MAAIPGVPDSSIIMKNALPPQAAEIIELYSLAIGYQSTLLVADRTRNTAPDRNPHSLRVEMRARARARELEHRKTGVVATRSPDA